VLLRRAAREDATAIWELRNAPDVRAASRRQHELGRPEFEREIVAAIEDALAEVFVVEVEGVTAGYVRIDPRAKGNEFEIGIAVASVWRGRGFGTAAIAEATHSFLESRPDAVILALVRPENPGSARAFEAAGYRPAGEIDDFRVYRAERLR
jgi:UDP-2,4-diacetamido-2,4,6-trideoxy-beta-L-altropyranose hydrolase